MSGGLRKKSALNPQREEAAALERQGAPEPSCDTPPAVKTSAGMRKSLSNAQSVEQQWIKPSDENAPLREAFQLDEVNLASIMLDENNTRTRHISLGNPTKNMLPPEHPDHKENQDLIDGLIELSEQLKVTPLQSPIAVYPFRGRFRVIFGSRRFLAMKIAFGDRYRITCKVYEKRPEFISAARLIENSSREDLSFGAKVIDFKNAYDELAAAGKLVKGNEWSFMGVSRAYYYKYLKVIAQHDVLDAIARGAIKSLDEALELIRCAKTPEERAALLHAMAIEDVSLEEARKSKASHTQDDAPARRKGRARTAIKLPAIKGDPAGLKAVKIIIDGGLKDMDWSDVNWADLDQVQNRLNENVDALIRSLEGKRG